MAEGLSSSLDEFSTQQKNHIRNTVREVLDSLSQAQRDRTPSFTNNSDFLYDPATCQLDQNRIDEICYQLHEATAEAEAGANLQALDAITANFFEHWFVPWGSWISSKEALTDAAYDLILRLASQALGFRYGHRDADVEVQHDPSQLLNMETETFISKNVARMALQVCILSERPVQGGRIAEPYWAMAQITEDIALLLGVAQRLSENVKDAS
ncbi:hypothetical protein B0J14DRAFT_560624 [Halenospora varia]|nr:hypothetical protein B0J14DRAFT_560624 [Halenospora varia]